ncbi:MAG: hypothetical protein H6636_00170 [Anaerolineales bacterium]|nr:hypothetical protein [Anaerolineales bacterium]
MELIRPVFLWLVLDASLTRRERLALTVKYSLPYYGVMAMLVIWRAFFLEIPGGDPNALKLLELIRENPLLGFQHGLTVAVQDFVHLIFAAWADALKLELFDISDRFLLASWGWGALIGILIFFFLWRVKKTSVETDNTPFYRQAIPLGFLAILMALLPTWATDNQISVGVFSSRFALPALLGTCIFFVGGLDFLFHKTEQKIIFLALCVSLATGVHLRSANEFRWDWVKQQRFFWQLAWRVPGLEDRTALFSDGAIFQYVGGYSTSSALNALYPLQVQYPEQSYWFVELDNTFWRDMDVFLNGAKVRGKLRNLSFSSTSQDGIVIFYEPEMGSCLWVLSPEDGFLGDLPSLTAQAASVSNLTRIQTEQAYSNETFQTILGPEPEHTWCYYYQKAKLAEQIEDWQGIISLGEEAARLGYEPMSAYEWFPFVAANAHLENWRQAEELILKAYSTSKKTRDRPAFCAFWNSLAPGEAAISVSSELQCDLLPGD